LPNLELFSIQRRHLPKAFIQVLNPLGDAGHITLGQAMAFIGIRQEVGGHARGQTDDNVRPASRMRATVLMSRAASRWRVANVDVGDNSTRGSGFTHRSVNLPRCHGIAEGVARMQRR
jgi:hypothetical protein